MKVANRLSQIAPFRVMALLARANQLAASGHDVIHLEVGEPDFATPQPIVRAGQTALSAGLTRYTDARGTPALREAIAAGYDQMLGVSIHPDRIFVSAGASGGLLLLSALLLNPGDNLLMTDPGYPCNRHFLASFDAEGILVPVTAADNYQLSAELVETYKTDRTRGVLLASPANPTGSVLGPGDFRSIKAAVGDFDGFMITDEIYQGLVYEPGFASVLQVDPDAIVINSFSKYFGMTGWRLGWLVVPEALSPDLEKLAQNLFICPSSISQAAALAAFDPAAIEIMEAQKAVLKERRDFLVPALKTLGFGIETIPAGAFYIYARLPTQQPDAEQFCKELLEEYYVAVTPGTDFGFYGADQHVRFSYARDISELKEAVRRIGLALGRSR